MLIDEYRLLAADNYHLQFTEVEIFGIFPSEEIMYRGSGAIGRGSDSRLTIMVSTSPNITFEEKRKQATRILREGQVIFQQLSCKMNAKDQLGRWWRDCEIFITELVNKDSKTTIIAELDKFALRLPRSITNHTHNKKIEIITIHKGPLPLNITQQLENTFSWNLSFNIPEFSIEITKDIPFTKITIRHESSVDWTRIKILLEAISICSGRIITPLLMTWHDDKHSHLEILHGQVDNNHLPSILDELPPFKIETFKLFLECYLSSFKYPYGETYAAWHRAYLAAEAGIEISSLALCTAIEGIVKYRFTEATTISVESSNELKEAGKLISEIEAPDWIIKTIQEHLERVLESKPTIRKSLKTFAVSNDISGRQITRWESLRNKIAHFDLLEDTPEENEKLINDYNICLSIFFKLIARSAGYSWGK